MCNCTTMQKHTIKTCMLSTCLLVTILYSIFTVYYFPALTRLKYPAEESQLGSGRDKEVAKVNGSKVNQKQKNNWTQQLNGTNQTWLEEIDVTVSEQQRNDSLKMLHLHEKVNHTNTMSDWKPITNRFNKTNNIIARMNYSGNNSSVHLVFFRPTWVELPLQGEKATIDDCNIPCFYSGYNYGDEVRDSSAVVFLLHQLSVIPWNTQQRSQDPDVILETVGVDPSSVVKVGMSMESTANYPSQFNLIDSSKYDIEFSYRKKSDVFWPYFSFRRYNLLKTVPDWHQRKSAVAFVASNCKSHNQHREKFVATLHKYVKVDSVGSCLHNTDWPSSIPNTNKLELLQQYKVYLAAENSIENDYVTEKIYQGLESGAVPIYLGTPNVVEFIPSNSAIVIPTNYTENDIIKVAQIVEKIFSDKSEYEKWTSFKNRDYEDWFERRFSFTRVHQFCRLCRKVLSLRKNASKINSAQVAVK